MKFKDLRKARKDAIEKEERLDRERQARANVFKRFVSDIHLYIMCIYGTYPIDPAKPEITPERVASFTNIRADILYNLERMKELNMEVNEKVAIIVSSASLSDFTCLEDCEKYIKTLESACRTIIMYY